jgi:Mce-associated membrane protein
MPPPRRRRPVQPATRVRIPRAVRSRDIPSGGESAGGPVPVAEAPGTDLSHDDLAQDNVAGPAPAAQTQTRDEPATGETLTGDEPATGEPTQDRPAAAEPATEDTSTQDEPAQAKPTAEGPAQDKPAADEPTASKRAADEPTAAGAQTAAAPGPSRHPLLLPGCLGALAVILGGLAVWFGLEASSATSGVDTSNTALTDPAATRQVTQQVTSAVNQIFSYNYADTAKTSQAAATLLTGKARQEYATLFKLVRQDAPKEKLVLTTTVTNSGVEFLDGSRARLLIFANQRDTAGVAHKTTDAGAMFAVNAVNQGGRWKISSIDTFGAAG